MERRLSKQGLIELYGVVFISGLVFFQGIFDRLTYVKSYRV